MKTERSAAILVPMTPDERRLLVGVARTLGLSTQALARLLFAYAVADITPIARYLAERRKAVPK